MATFERAVRVRAPFEDVWAFHLDVDGLRAVTPDWLRLRVDPPSSGGTAGFDPSGAFEHGDAFDLSVRPFGVGPRIVMTSRIAAVERTDDESGFFRDEMIAGPMREWTHTHTFRADGEHTFVHDRVEYETPLGGFGDRLLTLGLAPFFAYRHRVTKRRLEP